MRFKEEQEKDMLGRTLMAATLLLAGACDRTSEANAETRASARPAPAPTPVSPAPRKLYLDVHDLKDVKTADVAEAHKKDLAAEGKYGVDFKAYWVDEKIGKVYCLAEAPSAEAMKKVHQEAHGLVPKEVMEVRADNMTWTPAPGKKLFLDIHHLGVGTVTPEAVAGAHKKDLEVQSKFGVRYLDYWFDEANGIVMCLSEAPNAEMAINVHKEAHGLVPESIEEVTEGR